MARVYVMWVLLVLAARMALLKASARASVAVTVYVAWRDYRAPITSSVCVSLVGGVQIALSVAVLEVVLAMELASKMEPVHATVIGGT